MEYTAQIFIDSNAPLERLAAELEKLLGITMATEIGMKGVQYRLRKPGLGMRLKQHWYVSDATLNLEDYRYALELDTPAFMTDADRRLWFDDVVNPIYEGLKALEKYNLMLVDDLEFKLDEFVPKRQSDYDLAPGIQSDGNESSSND